MFAKWVVLFTLKISILVITFNKINSNNLSFTPHGTGAYWADGAGKKPLQQIVILLVRHL